ncbi:MAG: NAD(P)-dependent oxidoreductase [Mycolicibacterium hassiacum]|uniref:NAD-dependent epimerase/dehydratase family protein n=1 Tax=Mycolicibacterium hassiacum TaxID=46351 RepID=UPI0023F90C9F|nr:NAD(P)-dependent oxidoreductase [Mycolicibacterium hassiacum]MBX5489232.1 NAD(P)-dependent oxidoreductase [Mycolicibacterium hassiacum]
MKILFTGASSFTGMWFVRALVARDHEVVATFRRDRSGYDGLRGERVERVCEVAEARFGLSFGDEAFLSLLADTEFDVVCHHGAEVGDYRSPDFDVPAAFAANTRGAARVASRAPALVATGSVFESGEGAGERPLRAFSPYGLSKSLSAQALAYYCEREGARFGKFVISNPFGPFEEPRFTAYLVRAWRSGETARVATPAYVRDNIHVSLLAEAYARFVEEVVAGSATHLSPSGYVETQGAFARRFAAEMGPRLGLACPLELAEQREFPEPRVRIGLDRVEQFVDRWSEAAAWDELAAYYAASPVEATI